MCSVFHAAPLGIAACMYHTGLDSFTKEPVYIAKHFGDRKLQRALMQFFKPENYFEVRRALEQAGRTDLIGSGCDALIPDRPQKEAIDARRRRANAATDGDQYHTIANPAKGEKSGERAAVPIKQAGYRPGRKTQKRRSRQTGK